MVVSVVDQTTNFRKDLVEKASISTNPLTYITVFLPFC